MSHHAEGGRFAPPETAVEVSDGIFAYVQPDGSWWINNTGFVVGSLVHHLFIRVTRLSAE